MKDSRINYVVVGGFVSVMIVVFVFIISILAGSTGSTDKYYTVYNNVGGLKYGTQVLCEGYQIGQVDSIEPMFSPTMLSSPSDAGRRAWRNSMKRVLRPLPTALTM